MTDVMVDTETTGKDPVHNGILQLSAVKFNYDTGEIGDVFDRCPMLLPFRYWDDDTRTFWQVSNREHYIAMIRRQEPARQVFFDFTAFALSGAPQGGFRFWAKPTHFDWNFVASHYEQLEGPIPFFYRTARDVNSFIAGLLRDPSHPNMEAVLPFAGTKHNGLHDCAYQIDMLMEAKRRVGHLAEVLPPE
jgi:hypothetical protein